MTWVRLDEGYSEHLKVVGLSDKAFRTDIEGWCYCARNLTDGLLPMVVAHRWTRRAREELVAAGRWEIVDTGYRVHDYLAYNPSRAQVNEERSRKQAAGRAGGQASGQARASRLLPEEPNPVPSRPLPVLEPKQPPVRETRTYSVMFEEAWELWPKDRRQGKGKAEDEFKQALKRSSAAAILEGIRHFAADPNLPSDDPTKIPMMQTWLHGSRWDDGPLPSRNGHHAEESTLERMRRIGATS